MKTDLQPRDLSRHPAAFPNSLKIHIFTSFERKSPKSLSANLLNINPNFSRKSGLYRYSFNGKENESTSVQGSYDFGARIYDGRIGRWWSVDLISRQYPSFSSYIFALNNPLVNTDPDGNRIVGWLSLFANWRLKRAIRILSNSDTWNKMMQQFVSQQNINSGQSFGASEPGRFDSVELHFEYNSRIHDEENERLGNTSVQYFDTNNNQWKDVGLMSEDELRGLQVRINIVLYQATKTGETMEALIHEVIVHSEPLAEIVSRYEGGEISIQQLRSAVMKETFNAGADHHAKEQTPYKGESKSEYKGYYELERVNIEVIDYLRSNPAVNEYEVSYRSKNSMGRNVWRNDKISATFINYIFFRKAQGCNLLKSPDMLLHGDTYYSKTEEGKDYSETGSPICNQ